MIGSYFGIPHKSSICYDGNNLLQFSNYNTINSGQRFLFYTRWRIPYCQNPEGVMETRLKAYQILIHVTIDSNYWIRVYDLLYIKAVLNGRSVISPNTKFIDYLHINELTCKYLFIHHTMRSRPFT